MGLDEFAALFTRKSSGSELTLEIKKVLTRQKTAYTVGTGKNDDLTLVLLSAKSMTSIGDKLVGKSVKYYAEMVQRNAKKALAFIVALLVNGQMPSGKTFPDDFAEYLLDKMFRDEPKNKGKTRPSGWIFRGFWAFMLWGPMPLDGKPESTCGVLLSLTGEYAPGPKKTGRKNLRLEVAATEADSKKAKVAAKVESTIASSLPSKEERLVTIMSLHHDWNERFDMREEESLKEDKQDAFQMYQMELDNVKLNPNCDQTELDGRSKEV